MASRSRLSILFESLLLTTVLLSLSFSSCNATSRKILERTDMLEGAALPSNTAVTHSSAHSCIGKESSRTTTVSDQDLDMMHPIAAVAKNSEPRMSVHDGGDDWMRNSEHNSMLSNTERLRDSNKVKEDRTVRDSERTRDSQWTRDSADRRRDLERMRDPRAEGMSESADTMSDIDKKIRNPQRMGDSQRTRGSQRSSEWSTEKMRDFESERSIKDSERLRESDRSRGLIGVGERDERKRIDLLDHHDIVSGRQYMTDSEMPMRDTERMRDSQGMRIDESNMMDSDSMRDLHNSMHSMLDSDRMRDTHGMTNSDGMIDSDGLRDSEKMRTSHKMSTMDHKRSRGSEEMLNTHRMNGRDSETYGDSNQMMDQERQKDFSENMRNAERNNAQDQQSEMMRDSHRVRAAEGRIDLEMATATDDMMVSAAAQRRTDLDGEKGLGSAWTGDAEQMNDFNRRGALERRDSEKMRNSDHYMQGSEQMNANSHRMRNSPTGHMDRQHSSAMEPRSCQGADCHSTRDFQRMDSRTQLDQEAMPLSSRRLNDAQIIGSRAENSEAIGSSTSVGRCSAGMNAADCDAAFDGELQGSRSTHISKRNGLSSGCRVDGADCRVTHEANNNPQGGMSSFCTNDHCRTSIADNQEPMPEEMHRWTRNDREIVASPKWAKLERSSLTINHAKRTESSEKTSPMANQGMPISDSDKMRSADADREAVLASRDRHLGSIDAERRNSNMRGSEMQHTNSNHWTRSTAEITGQSSCRNEADCRRISGIMHVSPRDSEMMEHRDAVINDRGSCTNEVDCQSTSGTMRMSTRDSEKMGHRNDSEMTPNESNRNLENEDVMMDQEMADDSHMMQRESDHMNASTDMMRNSEEAAADNLPVHHGN